MKSPLTRITHKTKLISIISICLFLLCFSFTVNAQVSPDITVASDGSGDFTSIQAAIDAVSDNSDDKTIIFVKIGLYDTEKLLVPSNKTNVVLIGESRDETVISYHLHNCLSGGFNTLCPAEDAMLWSGALLETAATMTILGDGFVAENITIQNTAGNTGQAQAITVRADKIIFRNCNLLGYQDTIYFWSLAKRSYFENCLVLGRTDYIYGSGTAYFQECEIKSYGGGWITAPSTAQDQPHGFVFNTCDVTFMTGSPSPGDDNGLVALGRPWHNYPKVAWLSCDMTEKIHPAGWPTIWNMDYAPTSEDLHLYEYMNTGEGADMSNRADWVGIRALEDEEAQDYTIQAVLAGNDNWDPTADGPAVPVFDWTGNGATDSWNEAENWDPVAVPDTSEAAYVSGDVQINADGGYFAADLNILDSASILISSDSEVKYLALTKATILTSDNVSLSGKLRTKDSVYIDTGDNLSISAELLGVHRIFKSGEGSISLENSNDGFSGWWIINEGSILASSSGSLGESRGVILNDETSLTIDIDDAIYIETPLRVTNESELILNADITLIEFYIDDVLQDLGLYSSETHPVLISGTGTILIGRPDEFDFIGGVNGNWDNPDHFKPALLPEEGETVFNEIEMETTAFDFPADIVCQNGGRMRLRGVHTATGTITMNLGTSIGYATSSSGFTLNAPIVVEGDILLRMNSANPVSHKMTLGGPISGSSKVTAYNHRDDTANTGTVSLTGSNTEFKGIWDLTLPCVNPESVALIEGLAENSFGSGTIEVADKNIVILGHEKCAGDSLRVTLSDEGKIQLDLETKVLYANINGEILENGFYDATTNPEYFIGDGVLNVGNLVSSEDLDINNPISYANNVINVDGNSSKVIVYNLNGQSIIPVTEDLQISLNHLQTGIYVVTYQVDGITGTLKVLKK